MSLPKVVYVYEDEGNDGVKFLVVTTDSHEQSEGVVGVYELREKLSVRQKPQFRRAGTKTWFDKA